MKITFSVSDNPTAEVSSSLIEQFGILHFFFFFARRKITDACIFFSRGNHIEIVVLEDRERVHSNGN